MTPLSLTLLIVLCAGVTSDDDSGRCKVPVINKRNVIIYLNGDSIVSEKLECVRRYFFVFCFCLCLFRS